MIVLAAIWSVECSWNGNILQERISSIHWKVGRCLSVSVKQQLYSYAIFSQYILPVFVVTFQQVALVFTRLTTARWRLVSRRALVLAPVSSWGRRRCAGDGTALVPDPVSPLIYKRCSIPVYCFVLLSNVVCDGCFDWFWRVYCFWCQLDLPMLSLRLLCAHHFCLFKDPHRWHHLRAPSSGSQSGDGSLNLSKRHNKQR